MTICKEVDRPKTFENDELQENDIYCDYNDYEECSHNYIDEDQKDFIVKKEYDVDENTI